MHGGKFYSSPKLAKKSPRSGKDKQLYAVVKKPAGKSSRPSMSFEPPPPVVSNEPPSTVPSQPAARTDDNQLTTGSEPQVGLQVIV